MGKDLHKREIEKYYRENLEKNITSEIACPIENLLLGL